MDVSLYSFIFLSLASFRLTHLIMYDQITEKIRLLFLEEVEHDGEIYYNPKNFIGEIILCYWCCSVWASIILLILFFFGGSIGYFIILVLALSAVASVIEMIIQGDFNVSK